MLSAKEFVTLASVLSSLFVVASAWAIEEGATCAYDRWTGDDLIRIRDQNCSWGTHEYMLNHLPNLPFFKKGGGQQPMNFFVRLPKSGAEGTYHQGEMSNNYAAFDRNCNFDRVVRISNFDHMRGAEIPQNQIINCRRGYHEL
ncbi:BgTH12-01611 [Blumeria graminis f. sp. triticale]|uniref:BgTH12-01611 n=1 Tax=Blumeria graminis f. sp. triticale TaxID=1689686 RepID=A0A9W4DGI7_BLUGR|nr:BgTH12-01611 [Blumeria graminis f. sp. triticale]